MKVKVSKRLKAWCNKNYGCQGTLSYAIFSLGCVETDDLRLSNLFALENMAFRLKNEVPAYLKADVQAIINKITKTESIKGWELI